MNAISWPTRLGVGLIVGLIIAWVENVAFGGEVSPIVIIVMLIGATFTLGGVWGALHPNTYLSILMLAALTGAIASIGTLSGALLRRLIRRPQPG